MRNEASERKLKYRSEKGFEYADAQNEKAKEYQKTLAGKMSLRVSRMNRSANRRGAPEKIGTQKVIELWVKQNNLCKHGCSCAICGEHTNRWIIDHIKPISEGGCNVIENIQILCGKCHKEKTGKERRDTSMFARAIRNNVSKMKT